MTALTSASLASLTTVSTPSYDRDTSSVGIVHFGYGNFHRAHQAMYLDRLMEAGADSDWGICGVGVLPQDEPMRDVTNAQDCLYTLVLRHPDGSLDGRVVGSTLEYLFAPENPTAVIERLVDPAVRIVSLTVTEGGYLKNPATGAFDATNPGVVHDLAHPDEPRTAFAYIVEGLRRRRVAGITPFTVLSCDNLQGNGTYARQAVVGYAALKEPELAAWIEASVAFPNCMVDRITPATTDSDRTAVRETFGIDDRWPVPGEPFTQWIIEDRFPSGRPALETVGVQFVDDVTPYELMKLRLLNAGHQALAYLGAPLGYEFVDETMCDDRIRRFFEQYMRREVTPTLGDLPGIDLEGYMNTLVERFSNPHMRDTLVRLATDGSNRLPPFALPVLEQNLAAGRSITFGATLFAAWAQYWQLIGEGGLSNDRIPPDERAKQMRDAALAQAVNPTAFIEQTDLFGPLAQNPVFRAAFLAARGALVDKGVHGALDLILG